VDRAKDAAVLVGRLLLAVLFFTSSIAKIGSWRGNVDYVRAHHVPLPAAALACALAVELATWIGLTTGWRARGAAAAAFLYMIPVTLVFHAWMSTSFQKNLGIMGGLLLVAAFGPGRFAAGVRSRPASGRGPSAGRV
jgi:putative oxidoreductase